MEQSDIKNTLKDVFYQLKEYIDIRTTLISLQLKKIIIELIASAVSSLLVIIFIFFTLLFGSFATAFYIGAFYQNTFIGFVYVALGYLGLTLILLIFRKSIREKISSISIKLLFNEEDDA